MFPESNQKVKRERISQWRGNGSLLHMDSREISMDYYDAPVWDGWVSFSGSVSNTLALFKRI